MDKSEAEVVAREAFWQMRRMRDMYPEGYEWLVTEMDITDEAVDEAFEILFPGEDAGCPPLRFW